MSRLSLSCSKNQYTSAWEPEAVISVQKMKRHCLVSVHFHGNHTDLIKNKDSWGLVPVYRFPGWCMDSWNPSHTVLWAYNPDLVEWLFAVILISVVSPAQNFAHVMTAELSWHMLNSDLIWSLYQNCHQTVFFVYKILIMISSTYGEMGPWFHEEHSVLYSVVKV